VAYSYLGASMVVDANHPAVPTGLPEGPPSGRLTYAGSNKANAPWHGHPAWGPQGLARESQGRPGRAVAGQAHGRGARDTHGQDAHATHGRDAHATPLYDQAGNNVRGPRPADPNANNAAHFRYDAWNRLATIHLDDGGTSGTLDANDTLLATYRYDGLNRRVMKAVDVDGNSVTDYMFFNEGHGLRSLGEAGWQIVEVRRGVNQTPTAAPYKQFVYDIRYIDSPVCRWWDKDSDGTMEPASGEMQYFTNDGNFNTTALVDANSGSVVERYLYDPYGRVTVLNGASGAEKDPNVAEWSPDADNKSDWDNEILFCGYWYDPETGLFHVRERYYDPLTGTWKTRDKSGYRDGPSLYEYCKSAPYTFIDGPGTTVETLTNLGAGSLREKTAEARAAQKAAQREADKIRKTVLDDLSEGKIDDPDQHPDARRYEELLATADAYEQKAKDYEAALRALNAPKCGRCGPDVTNWLIREMAQHFNHPVIQGLRRSYSYDDAAGVLYGLYQFAQLVKSGGPWDFKATEPFTIPSLGCPSENCGATVTICGVCFAKDVPGNIHYGYVGRAAWIREWLIYAGGHYADPRHADSTEDRVAISIGIAMVENGSDLCSLIREKQAQLNRDNVKGCWTCKHCYK